MKPMFYDYPADYLSYLPEILQDAYEMQRLAGAINPQLDGILAMIQKVADNKSVTHADEEGIARWEKILGITSPLNSTLQARRDACRAKLMSKPPINLEALRAVVEAYMGVPVSFTVENYVITGKYRGQSRIADLNPLYETVYGMIPAELLFVISYLYATWGEVKEDFPSWGAVKQKTWNEIRMGV